MLSSSASALELGGVDIHGFIPVIAEEKAPAAHGEQLHNDKCMTCHTTKVYSRYDRRVKTLQALSNLVNNCMKGSAKAEWTEIETSSVIDYLNQKFYKF